MRRMFFEHRGNHCPIRKLQYIFEGSDTEWQKRKVDSPTFTPKTDVAFPLWQRQGL